MTLSDAEALKQLRQLVCENILPRMLELEEQVRLLRKVTWPVCQRLTEKHQMTDIDSKREFLQHLDEDEVWMLLKAKSQGRPLVKPEYEKIMSTPSKSATGHRSGWFP